MKSSTQGLLKHLYCMIIKKNKNRVYEIQFTLIKCSNFYTTSYVHTFNSNRRRIGNYEAILSIVYVFGGLFLSRIRSTTASNNLDLLNTGPQYQLCFLIWAIVNLLLGCLLSILSIKFLKS